MESLYEFFVVLGSGMIGGLVLTIYLAIKFSGNELEKSLPKSERQSTNLQILARLLKYVEEHPNQRFGQILLNTGVVDSIGVKDSSLPEHEMPTYYWKDGFYEESFKTLVRMEIAERGIFNKTEIVKGIKK